MPLHCDNTIAMHIASNIVYHELTKHIEVNCHFMREKVIKRNKVEAYYYLESDCSFPHKGS